MTLIQVPSTVMKTWRQRMANDDDDSNDSSEENYHFILPTEKELNAGHRLLKQNNKSRFKHQSLVVNDSANSQVKEEQSVQNKNQIYNNEGEQQMDLETSQQTIRMRSVDIDKIYSQNEKDQNAVMVGVFFDKNRKLKRHADGSTLIKKFVQPILKTIKLRKLSPQQQQVKNQAIIQSYQISPDMQGAKFNHQRNNSSYTEQIENYNDYGQNQQHKLPKIKNTSVNSRYKDDMPNYTKDPLVREVKDEDQNKNTTPKINQILNIQSSNNLMELGKSKETFLFGNQGDIMQSSHHLNLTSPKANQSFHNQNALNLHKFTNILNSQLPTQQQQITSSPTFYEKNYTRFDQLKELQDQSQRRLQNKSIVNHANFSMLNSLQQTVGYDTNKEHNSVDNMKSSNAHSNQKMNRTSVQFGLDLNEE
eukprot:403374942